MKNVERTINGKTFKEVLEELNKPFEGEWRNYHNHAYLPIEEVEQRLDDVLGLNYSFILSEPIQFINTKELNLSTGEEKQVKSFVGVGEIIIYDDLGTEICRRASGHGANAITHEKGNLKGLSKDLTNDYASAVSYIKKKCAMAYGVGRYLVTDRKNNNNGNNRSSNANKNQSNSNSNVLIALKLLSKGNTFNNILKFDVTDSSGRRGEMIIFNDTTIFNDKNRYSQILKLPVNSIVNATLRKEHIYKDTLQFIIDDITAIK